MTQQTTFETFNAHLLNDATPSLYFQGLLKGGLFPVEYPFKLLKALTKTEQNPKYHPEGNVWEHTMQVVDAAARYRHLSSEPQVFMWSSLLHDIGKGSTTKIKGDKITAYDHDIVGAQLTKDFLTSLTGDQMLIKNVCNLVRWHMQPLFVYKKLPFSRLDKMMEKISPSEVGLFSICDRLGRNNLSKEDISDEIEFVKVFLNACNKKTDDIEEKTKVLKIIYGLEESNTVIKV